MPVIRPSADLRNRYTYEMLAGKIDLHRLIDSGLESEKAGRVRPAEEVLTDIRATMNL